MVKYVLLLSFTQFTLFQTVKFDVSTGYDRDETIGYDFQDTVGSFFIYHVTLTHFIYVVWYKSRLRSRPLTCLTHDNNTGALYYIHRELKDLCLKLAYSSLVYDIKTLAVCTEQCKFYIRTATSKPVCHHTASNNIALRLLSMPKSSFKSTYIRCVPLFVTTHGIVTLCYF